MTDVAPAVPPTIRSLDCSPTRDQVDDQHHNSDDQQDVNQAAGDMEAESQDPEDQKDHKDSPEHALSPFYFLKEPEKGVRPAPVGLDASCAQRLKGKRFKAKGG